MLDTKRGIKFVIVATVCAQDYSKQMCCLRTETPSQKAHPQLKNKTGCRFRKQGPESPNQEHKHEGRHG